MSKYMNRINKLIIKTHNYLSYSNNCIVRDYYKARFEESEKPEDFEQRYKEFLRLEREYNATPNDEIRAKLDEVLGERSAVSFKLMYEWSIKHCEKYPNGIWQPKSLTDNYLKLITEAKRYLKNKKSKN